MGVVWTPEFANLSVAVDYFDYKVQGEIANLGASDIISGSRNLGVWSEIGVSPGTAS